MMAAQVIDFEARVRAARAAAADKEWLQELVCGDNGRPTKGVANIAAVLRHHPEWKGSLSFDEFRGVPLLRGKEITDKDATAIREWIECEPHMRMSPGDADVHKVLDMVSGESAFHPVRDYLSSVVWDGVPRLGTWLSTYLGAEDNLYTRTVGSKWLIAACARVWRPGCKVDTVLILEGKQGAGKSTALRILAGDDWFTDTPIDLSSKDAYQSLRGCWVIELGELASLRKSDLERAKAFFSAGVDKYRPSYGRRDITVPRQCVFAGSTNLDEYLPDPTGNRRFWPATCGTIDLEGLARDRDQLWAEAMACLGDGVPWWIDNPEVIALATKEQAARRPSDAWSSKIATWLKTEEAKQLRGKQSWGVTARDVLEGALGYETKDITRREENRVTEILKTDFRATDKRPRINGIKSRVWIPDPAIA